MGQGAGQNDAVSFTAGKVNARPIAPAMETNRAQGVVDDILLADGSTRPRIAVRGPAESDRFGNGQFSRWLLLLPDNGNGPRTLSGRHSVQIRIVDLDGPRCRSLQTSNST